MKRVVIALTILASLWTMKIDAVAGNIGDPGATLNKGQWSLGPEVSGVFREISDRMGTRYDAESWRFLLKGSYGVTNWLEGFGRLGSATIKLRGLPFSSDPGFAGGAGLKVNFLDPPEHPLRYSAGGQFLYSQAEDGGATGKWFEYDLWLGVAYKDWKKLTPYGGVVYSGVDGKLTDLPAEAAVGDFKSATGMGVFFGVDWKIYERWHLGVDARLSGENSGNVSLVYRF